MPDGPQPVEIPVAPPTSERNTPTTENSQTEQRGFHAKKFAEKIRAAFSRSGNSREALQDISDSDPNETPTATKSKHAANKEYRQRMKHVVRENYNWTGFAKETYNHKDFAHQEREAYAKAYGDEALAARDAATPQPEKPEPEKPEKEQKQSAEGHHTTQPSEDDLSERRERRRLLDMLSDEQLEDRIAISDSGAKLAKKTLEERQRGQQTPDAPQSTPTSEPTPLHGEDKQDEGDDIPTDKRDLFLFEKEHFDSYAHLPQDKVKEAFTPQIVDLYRRFLQHKIKMLIDNKPPDVTYPDTVAGVLGNNAPFLQRTIYAGTDYIVDMEILLKEPFSKIAAMMKIELPDDYAKHFRKQPNTSTQESDEGREAA